MEDAHGREMVIVKWKDGNKGSSHVAYQALYHIVWIPKYRGKVFVDGVKEYLEKTIQTLVIDRYPDVYVQELNARADHVHALIEIPPKYSVSSVVGYIKGVSAKKMRMYFEYLRRGDLFGLVGFS